jgi:crotonobetainyl-CoA:carnitine CoA-transferase CaiB-like acyl-CoA transferase
VLSTGTSARWLEALDRGDVPAAPILKRSEVIVHPQVLAAGIIEEYPHPVAGRLRQARVPARFLGTPVEPPRGAPQLGEHNEEVLAELGLTHGQISDFVTRGVIGGEHVVPDAETVPA